MSKDICWIAKYQNHPIKWEDFISLMEIARVALGWGRSEVSNETKMDRKELDRLHNMVLGLLEDEYEGKES